MSGSASRVRMTAFFCLAVPALLRTLIVITANPYFSMDPREFVAPLEGVGPLGAGVLDAISICGLWFALAAEFLDRRAPDYKCLILGAIPVPILFWHASLSTENMFVASGWLAAIATGLGALHVARDRIFRRLGVAVVAAIVAPLVIKGIYQVTLEHAGNIAAFNANRDSILRSRGWGAGSPEAQMFVRRISQREATGWFALSNVYGSLLAGLAVFWVTTALNAARSRASSGVVALTAIFAVGGIAGLAVSFSKGAIAAGLVGMLLAGLSILPAPRRRSVTRNAARLTGVLIIAAIGATIVRGVVLGPDGFNPDGYSLLFRWQYWVGAAGMVAQHPLTGVGPGGFQNAYILLRPVLSPEEVASAHNVYVDWLATLGVSAIAWVVLTILWLARCAPGAAGVGGRQAREEAKTQATDESDDKDFDTRRSGLIVLLIGLFAIGGAWFLNRHVFTIEYQALLAPLSILAFFAAGVLIWSLAAQIPVFLSRWSLWTALTVFFVHSQIETTLTQPGSASIIFLLLGFAAGRTRQGTGEHSMPSANRLGGSAIVGAIAFWIGHVVFMLGPTFAMNQLLSHAYLAVSPIGELRQAVAQVQGAASLNDEVEALHDVQILFVMSDIERPIDRMTNELTAHVRAGRTEQARRVHANILSVIDETMDTLERRQLSTALSYLADARRLKPFSLLVWKTSIGYEFLAARQRSGDDGDLLATPVELAEQLVDEHPELVTARAIAMQMRMARYESRNAPADLDAAIEHGRRAAELDQHGITPTGRLAELLDRAGRLDEALVAYKRSLVNNANMRLDRVKQLSDEQRRAVEMRIAELENR